MTPHAKGANTPREVALEGRHVVLGDGGEALREPGARQSAGGRLWSSVETNAAASACILLVAVLCQELESLDAPIEMIAQPATSHMRISSLVCATMFGAPTLKGVALSGQRAVLGAIMAALAWLGDNRGNAESRTGDVLYTAATMLMAIRVYSQGGIEAPGLRPDSTENENGPHRRRSVAGLCAALLLYVGLRGLRATWCAPEETRTFTASYDVAGVTVSAVGHAHSSTQTILPLAFGHGLLVSAAVIIGFSSDSHAVGSSAVAFEIAGCGMATLSCALWATLGTSAQMQALPVLYGEGACIGDRDTCHAAHRARRFAFVNNGASSLWVSGFGMLVFSFAVEKRLTGTELTKAERLWKRQGFSIGLAVLAVCVCGCFSFMSFALSVRSVHSTPPVTAILPIVHCCLAGLPHRRRAAGGNCRRVRVRLRRHSGGVATARLRNGVRGAGAG